MPFMNFGQEGELSTGAVVLDTSGNDVDHRGNAPLTAGQFVQFSFGARPEIWYHGKVYQDYPSNVPNSSWGSYNFFSIKDASGNVLLTAHTRRVGNPDQHRLYFRGINGDSTAVSDLAGYGDLPYGRIMTYDFHAKLTGTTMELAVYINGSVIATRTVVGVAPVWGQPAQATYGHFGSGVGTSKWYEIGASDTPTVGVGLSTLEATGAGFHTTGLGAYTDITEAGVDITTVVDLPTVGDKVSWIIEPLVGKTFGTTAIKHIVATSLVVDTDLIVIGYRYFIRSGGVDYPTAGGTHTPTGITTNIIELVSINPVTGNAFTSAEIDAGIEIGIEAV